MDWESRLHPVIGAGLPQLKTTSMLIVTTPMKIVKYLACTLLASLMIQGQSFAADSPKVGDNAPQFAAKDESGTDFKSADLIGKKPLILYFYPKDNTPGCTTEACGLRDRMGDLKKQGVEVVGVSFDSPESHQKFISDHKLNFKLVSDMDGKVADAYGAKNANGKTAKRISFLIDSKGKVVHVTDNRDAAVHLQEMKEAVAALK